MEITITISTDNLKAHAEALLAKGKDALRELSAIKEELRETVSVARERDPSAKSRAEVLFLYPGVHAVAAHRISHRLYESNHFFAARAISQTVRHLTGIEIHPGATIGKGFFIDHGMGVVIGETTEIGDNCTVYQGATLGGTGKDTGKRHPTLGNNVMVGAGARVLGPVTVGNNVKIAAGAVVLHSVPDNCTAVGIPAKIVRRDGEKVVADLDQVHIPDPVAQELTRIKERIDALETQQAKADSL